MLDLLLQAMNFNAKSHQILVNLQRFLLLILSLKRIAKGKISIDILLVLLDALLKLINGFWVLTADVVQDSRVV